jgi:hypothetical protein
MQIKHGEKWRDLIKSNLQENCEGMGTFAFQQSRGLTGTRITLSDCSTLTPSMGIFENIYSPSLRRRQKYSCLSRLVNLLPGVSYDFL